MSTIEGRAWVFGDDVNTDVMAPGLYFKSPMSEMARHCMEAIDPDFAPNVQPGDIVLAGQNFGIGSAREQAPMALQHLGVGAVLAQSFGRIFYRNALNFGIPAIIFPAAAEISPGDQLRVDPVSGDIQNRTTGQVYAVNGLPRHLMTMVEAGGLMPYLKNKLASTNEE
jgi:3-isopropylmalate/(R)-2-methylmalate dehydratase small subunit